MERDQLIEQAATRMSDAMEGNFNLYLNAEPYPDPANLREIARSVLIEQLPLFVGAITTRIEALPARIVANEGRKAIVMLDDVLACVRGEE